MTDIVDKVTVDFIANVTAYMQGLAQAGGATTQFAKTVGDAADTVKRKTQEIDKDVANLQRGFTDLKKQVLGFFAISGAVGLAKSLAEVADTYSNIIAKTQLATAGQLDLRKSMDAVFESSQRTYASFEATTSLVSRNAQALRNMGMSAQDSFSRSLQLSEVFNKALVVSGSNATEAAAAVMQFGQALASNKFQGDEFRTVLETNTRFAQLLADSLGINIAKLREWSAEGKLTTSTILGVINNTEKLNAEFAKMPLTISRSMQQLSNAWTKYIGEADQAAGSSRKVAESIQYIATNIATITSTLVTAAEIAAAYFAIYKLAIPTMTMLSAQMRAYIAEQAALSAAQEMGMARTAASVSMLTKAAGVLMAAFAGWEIGKWLYDNFETARLAGIALVEQLTVGWEYVKSAGGIMWEYISGKFKVMVSDIRSGLADVVEFYAKVADKIPALGMAGMAAELHAVSASIRGTTETWDKYAVRIAVAKEETTKTVERIRTDFAVLAEAAADVNKKTEAGADSWKKYQGAIQQTMPDLVVTGKDLKQAAKDADDLAAAQQRLADMLGKVEGAADPVAKVWQDYAANLRDAAEQGARMIKAGADEAEVQRVLVQYINAASVARDKQIATIKRATDVYGNYLKELKNDAALLGMTDKQKAIERAIQDVTAAYEKLTQAQKDMNPPLEEMIENVRKAEGAFYDQKKAAEQYMEQAKRFKAIVTDAFDSALKSTIDWALSGFKHTKDFMQSLVDIVKRAVAAMLFEWAKTKIIGWLGGSTGGTGGGWMGLISAGVSALGGSSSGSGAGSPGGATGGFNYANAVGGQGSSGMGSYGNMLMQYGQNYFGNQISQGAVGTWMRANPGTTATIGGVTGALAGAYYGSQQGDGSVLGTGGSTAAGAIAGYTVGAAVAGSAATGAGVMGAAASVPVIGWIALIALVVDKITGGKIFGSKWAPSEHRFEAGFSSAGPTARSQVDEWKYQNQASQAFGRFGGALLPSDWGDKDKRTRDLPVDPKVLAELKKINDAVLKTYTDAAKVFRTDAVDMLDAEFLTKTTYDKKGKPKGTETTGIILGKEYKEDMSAFVKRMHAEAFIQTAEQVEKGVSLVMEAYRANADTLLDAAGAMTQAFQDIADGKKLLGSGEGLVSTIEWMEKQRNEGEKLSEVYARLMQASEQYRAIMTNVDSGLKALIPQTAGDAMTKVLTDLEAATQKNIKALEAAALAAGLTGAAEEDLAKIRELQVRTIEKMSTDFWKGINNQILEMQEIRTPSMDFFAALRTIQAQMRDNVDQANILARAQGQAGASAAEVGRIYTLAARQTAAAMATLQRLGEQQSRSLYGGIFTIEDIDAELAARRQATESLHGFNDAIVETANAANEAINLLLGDKSPLNDAKKLQIALGGLMEGSVSADQVLGIGRRLYSTSRHYTDLFNMVMAMRPEMKPTSAGGGSFVATSTSSSSMSGLSTEELEARRDEIMKRQRFLEAQQFAETVATMAEAQGKSYEEIAELLQFTLPDLARDLGLDPEKLKPFLDDLAETNQAIPDAVTTAADRIIETLERLLSPTAPLAGGPLAEGGKPVAEMHPGMTANKRVVETIEATSTATVAVLDKAANVIDRLERTLRDDGIQRPRSDRYPVLNP